MFRTETKDYSVMKEAYSDIIHRPSSLSSPTKVVNTTNLAPSTLSSPSSSVPDCFMNISPTSAPALPPPLSSQTQHLLQSQVEPPDLPSATTTPSGKLMRPPQRPPACRACKRRKSKCDFELPCSTCMLHNTVESCVYDKLAIPRDRKPIIGRSSTGATSLSTRTSELKSLRSRLQDAEKQIAAQKVTIQTQQATLDMHYRSNLSDSQVSARPQFTSENHVRENSSRSKVVDSPPDPDSPAPVTLADEITRLVIDTAIAPSTSSNEPISPPPRSPPSSPPASASITNSSSHDQSEGTEAEKQTFFRVHPVQEVRGLQADVLRLILTHCGLNYLARHIKIGRPVVGTGWLGSLSGINGWIGQPPAHTASIGASGLRRVNYQSTYPATSESNPSLTDRPSAPIIHPPTTILPSRITVQDPQDLAVLFPPQLCQALRLLESYLGSVNQVHHLVDGEQARLEFKLFYDSYISAHPPVPSSRPAKPDGNLKPPMPIPELWEIGWLSGTLAIFVLGSCSDKEAASGDNQTLRTVWLKGALEGLAYRFGDANGTEKRPIDLSALRCACLVVWIFVLYGEDQEILPAVNFNSSALYRACDQLQLHRDPLKILPEISTRVAEDRRRIFYNMINTDWLFSAIIGKTYSPVSLDGHDVRIPSYLEGRDENSSALQALGFRSRLMRQLRKLATMWMGSGMICEDPALAFEKDLDQLDFDLPDWCAIEVDNFKPAKYTGNNAHLTFSQQIITNVQLCAVRVRFHSKLAVPSHHAPQWVRDSAPHHRKICIERAIRLLRLEKLHLTFTTRMNGHRQVMVRLCW
ncbi:hypothetical protein CROQUDRAFT_670414 [Cronartium quercuum f. sp. fusiforme G11]|uniref:Zn(2)-C6 fungal-type domain-containing protein n=1 Tax=Cronartium quercuum f. sp. fusiforme G11 TaxID=708437 RepID=A0A9P6NQF2_9BASI|nr:hypothetical protein CROQUDRAFT_670414 [Cronartium quercuum f. sp. fusiforme G11]